MADLLALQTLFKEELKKTDQCFGRSVHGSFLKANETFTSDSYRDPYSFTGSAVSASK